MLGWKKGKAGGESRLTSEKGSKKENAGTKRVEGGVRKRSGQLPAEVSLLNKKKLTQRYMKRGGWFSDEIIF